MVDYLAAQKYARPAVARILRHYPDDVDDVLQDATLKVIAHADQFRGDCQFRTYFYRIAVNMALMRLRSRWQRFVDVPEDLPEPGPGLEARVLELERKEKLLAAAAKELTPLLQQEFIRYLDEETDYSAGAKARRHRIRNKLRVALAGAV